MEAITNFLVQVNVAYISFIQGIFPTATYDDIYFYTVVALAAFTLLCFIIKCLTSYTSDDLTDKLLEVEKRYERKMNKQRHAFQDDLSDSQSQNLGLIQDIERLTKAKDNAVAEAIKMADKNKELEQIVNKISSQKNNGNCYEVERMIVALIRENDDFEELERKAQNLVEAMK